MTQQHKQGRPQGGQHGWYEEGRRQSQGGYGYGEDNGRSAAGSNYGDVGNTRQGRDSDYRGGYGGSSSYSGQEPWRGEGQGNPSRDWDYEAGSGRREGREYGNYGRQDYGNYGAGNYGAGSQRRPQEGGQTGAYGMDTGQLRGYGDMAYGRGGRGEESGSGSRHQDEFDPDYLKWRNEQMQSLDNDYHSWRQDRFKKFSDEFSSWRGQRRPSNEENGGSSSGTSSGSSPAVSGSSSSKGSQ
jgi:hypothetical protein